MFVAFTMVQIRMLSIQWQMTLSYFLKQNTMISEAKIKQVKILIIIASIAIPLVVALLFGVKVSGFEYLNFLPSIYAGINALTAVFLVLALVMVKMKNFKWHERFIKTCMVLSLLFLVMYVVYHMTSTTTVYGDLNFDGKLDSYEHAKIAGILTFYRIILFSHIILSMIIVPLVLFTYFYAWKGDFEMHKKWTRFAWPIWFYVAVTGVIVYLMILPYYAR